MDDSKLPPVTQPNQPESLPAFSQHQEPENPDESPDLMSKNENLYIRQLDAHQREIRLLSFAATADVDDSILLELCYVSLNDYPYFEYDALSYTWGNPVLESQRNESALVDCLPQSFITTPIQENGQNVETRQGILSTIWVNGQQHEVTENLFSALGRLRQIDRKHFLWVDAICINQEDLRERTDQVKLMGDIYRNAKEVLIWLGDENGTTDSEMAMDLLEHLWTSFGDFVEDDLDEGVQEVWNQLETDLDAMERPGAKRFEDTLGTVTKFAQVQTAWINNIDFFSLTVRCDQRAWDSVARLLTRSWFWRVWTFQEKMLAEVSTVLVGTKSISWVHLSTAMTAIMIHDNLCDKTPVLPKGEYAYFQQSNSLSLRVLERGIDFTGRGLFDLVRETQQRQCKDPRDKIYGILGTVIENDPGFIHLVRMVDYEAVSTQVLYTEFARFYIQDQGDLRILQCCNFSLANIEGLPTWVPDWTTVPNGTILASRAYRAAGEFKGIVEHDNDTSEISIWGVVIDKIKLLAPLAYQKETQALLSGGHLSMGAKVLEAFAAVYLAASGSHSDLHGLEGKWLELSRVIKWHTLYISGETYAEAYWRTLVGDRNPNSRFHVNDRLPREVLMSNAMDTCTSQKPIPDDFQPNEPNLEIRYKNFTSPYLTKIWGTTATKRFFLTERGFMGLATENAKEGDVAVVLLGGNVPFLLRENGDHYEMVGESYGMGPFRSSVEEKDILTESLPSTWLHGWQNHRYDERRRATSLLHPPIDAHSVSNREDVDITGVMLVALAYSTDAEMVELALNKRKHRIIVQVVEAARENKQYHLEVLNLLLSKIDSSLFDRQ